MTKITRISKDMKFENMVTDWENVHVKILPSSEFVSSKLLYIFESDAIHLQYQEFWPILGGSLQIEQEDCQ